jgi:hypothetical protein
MSQSEVVDSKLHTNWTASDVESTTQDLRREGGSFLVRLPCADEGALIVDIDARPTLEACSTAIDLELLALDHAPCIETSGEDSA